MHSTKPRSRVSSRDAGRPSLAALWDSWCLAAAEATLALADWHRATGADRRFAFARYQDALEREERAAGELEDGVLGAR